MIWNLIGTIGGKVLDVVDDVVEDKDEANKLKFQIQRQLIETKGSELEAQAKIVLDEAQGSWLQRNWRPLLIGRVCWSGGRSLVRLHRQQHPGERSKFIAQHRHGWRRWLRNGPFSGEGRQQMATKVNIVATQKDIKNKQKKVQLLEIEDY